MKTSHVLLALVLLVACQKTANITQKITPPTAKTTTAVTTGTDTIPDKASFKILLAKDSVNTDETVFVFNKTSGLNYDPSGDAPYFTGTGQVSLASISGDGRDLAINKLPYTPGMSVGLDVHTKTDGTFLLKMSYENNIPVNKQVWLRDTYLKDSLNIRTGNYNFDVVKADTNSFGRKRFKLVIK